MRNCPVPRQACCCVQSSDSAAREQLEKVVEVLDTLRCRTFEDCIAWARHRFQVRHKGRCCAFPTDQGRPLVSLSDLSCMLLMAKTLGCSDDTRAHWSFLLVVHAIDAFS